TLMIFVFKDLGGLVVWNPDTFWNISPC
ncbi:unnamed protein product, partial [Allacma fusca]